MDSKKEKIKRKHQKKKTRQKKKKNRIIELTFITTKNVIMYRNYPTI